MLMSRKVVFIQAMAAGFSLLFLLSGCLTVTLVSSYDETTEQQLTQLQTSLDDFVDLLEESHGDQSASYENNKGFYEGMERDLRILIRRVDSIPDNSQTRRIVRNLSESIIGLEATSRVYGDAPDTKKVDASLRALHQLGGNRAIGIDAKTLDAARGAINTHFRAAITLEIAKKRGDDNG